MVLNRYQLVLNAQSFIYIYIWIWVHRLWFPLHSVTMYWMSDRFCLFCSLFLILDLDLVFELQLFFLYLMEILNILLFSELFVCFLRYWGRKRCWIYWIFLNLGLNVKLCCYLKWIGFFSWKLKHHIWTNIYIFKQKGPKLNHLQFNFISKQTNPTMPYRVLHV